MVAWSDFGRDDATPRPDVRLCTILNPDLIDSQMNSEHLKTIPDVLETLMSEKRLLQASVLLVRSLKMINKADMAEIGAVVDLRSYLVGQETVSSCVEDVLVNSLIEYNRR